MSKNLLARIAVAIVAIPAILWVCYKGGDWLFGMILFFALVAMSEFAINEGFKPKGFYFWFSLLVITAVFLSKHSLSTHFFLWLQVLFNGMSGILVFFLISAMLFGVGKLSPAELFTKHSRLLWGIFYIGVLYPYVYMLGASYNQLPGYNLSGGDWLLFLFGILWVGDTE